MPDCEVDLSVIPFMSNSRIEMLNLSSISLHILENVLSKIPILIPKVGPKRTVILIKSLPHQCDGAEYR